MNLNLPGDCPSGENCPVHFRINNEVNRDGYFCAITYVGKYCVMTTDNPNAVALDAKLHEGKIDILEWTRGVVVMAPWSSLVYEVGENGTLYDIAISETMSVSVRWSQDLEFFNGLHAAHEAIVSALTEGLLDA